MAIVEPNMLAKDISGVHIENNPQRQEVLQTNAYLAFEMGLIKRKVTIKNYLNTNLT